MPKPVPYSQIRREVMAKRKLKPWEISISSPDDGEDEDQQQQPGSIADEPMAQAMKREQLMKGLAPMGEVANPETEAAKKKKSRGLIHLMLGMMR